MVSVVTLVSPSHPLHREIVSIRSKFVKNKFARKKRSARILSFDLIPYLFLSGAFSPPFDVRTTVVILLLLVAVVVLIRGNET